MLRKMIPGIVLTLLIANTLLLNSNLVQTSAGPEEQEIICHHFLVKTGNCFELNNSEYLNVTITSTATIRMILSAPPEMIDYSIESADGSDSTILTLDNLQPSTTYYMYTDGYMNENVFTTDNNGSYTYTQDISNSHHVFIQPRRGTTYIYEDTTLTNDIYGSVQITADNIVLDLNGYSIIGSNTGTGVSCSRTGVTIKNGTIDKFTVGVWIGGSYNRIANVTISYNFDGVHCQGHNNLFVGNDITNRNMGIVLQSNSAKQNHIYGNTFSNNGDVGIFVLFAGGDNKIYHNNFVDNAPIYPTQAEVWYSSPDIWDDGYPSGGNYWNDYAGVDFYGGPNQNVIGSDGIGDTPYVIYTLGGDNRDIYPLISPWTSAASKKDAEVTRAGQTYPVQLVSNATIDDFKSTSNNLRFDLSGTGGTSAYVALVVPVGLNTTKIKIFVNKTKLTPPPYPVITANSTHYFVYFTVTFASSYEIVMLFAPVAATVDHKPDTLNLKSWGTYVTIYAELPEEYNVGDIDVSTIKVNDTIAVDMEGPSEIGDYDNDGNPDLMMKFNRTSIIEFIENNKDWTDSEDKKRGRYQVTLTVTGAMYNGIPLEGSDTIYVLEFLKGHHHHIHFYN